jgi:hypothetical protein
MDGALGPGYSYWKNIKSPSELGMSSEGTIHALSKDVKGLISYVSVLVDGKGDASKTGEPLGNRFLLETMARCRNVMSDRSKPDSEDNPIYVPRYIYTDNVPDGTIPFISSGPDGGKLKDFRGLIPGAIGNLSAFSPTGFYRAFTMGNYPDCIKIALRTKDIDNNDGVQTEYVAVADILNEISADNMPQGNPINGVTDPCKFKDYTHPVTGDKKTKEVCEPDAAEDGFSMLLPLYPKSRDLGSNADSDSESESDSRPASEEETRERRALKQMRKMRRREKRVHEVKGIHAHLAKNRSQNKNSVIQDATSDDAEFGSRYDAMRFDGNTMFDDRSFFASHVDTDAQTSISDEDIIARLYYGAIAGVGLYILYRILYTKRK